MATASEIAYILVQNAISLDRPITNMKLQKMLYFSWIEYYKKNEHYLFNEEFSAWRFGPVVDSVYRDYRIFAAMKITFPKGPEADIDEETKIFLRDFSKRYKETSVTQLVSKAHADNKPWKEVYNPDKMGIKISFDRIVELECQN